jgi:hypothetical protein
MPQNKQILLDNRPQGEATASNFKLVTSDTPVLADGQVLVVITTSASIRTCAAA